MAADNEHRLLSKVVSERDINSPLKAGVKEAWFLDEETRAVWRFVVQHHAKYGEVPTAVTVKDNYPNFRLLKVEDSLEYLIDKATEFIRFQKVNEGLANAVEILGETRDTEAILQALSTTIADVNAEGVPGTNEINLSADPMARLEAYKELGKHGGMLGIPTGFQKIDEATAGLQGGQLITIIAPPKTGKSQLAMAIGINVHKADYSLMFQSFEMSNREQQERHDALRAGISHGRLRRGLLKPGEYKAYERALKSMEGEKDFHLTDAVSGLTVTALSALVENNQPDLVIVDGVYLMIDDVTGESNTPQALTNITRNLKRMAQRFDIPTIITTQTLLWKMRGGKVSADSIGYSSSFFQDSDVILGLEPVEDDEESRTLKIVESRNCGKQEIPLVWNWDTACFHEVEKIPDCVACSSGNWS